MFLFRPPPTDGESLSSWRQRSGMENGFRLYPIQNEPRRTDPDQCRPDVLNWLRDEFGLRSDQLAGLTLDRLTSRLTDSPEGRRGRWLVPVRYTNSIFNYGPTYCPLCLASYKSGYFRLEWRIAFVTDCPLHDCELLDHCHGCNALVWPHPAARAELFGRHRFELFQCAYCRHDLRTTKVQKTDASVSGSLLSLTASETVQIGREVVSAKQYFDALSIVCQLFVRNRVTERLGRGGTRWRELARRARVSNVNQVEAMNVADRKLLVGAAVDLMSDWPTPFLKFAEECGVQHHHFVDASCAPPTWMAGVIGKYLRAQLRGTTEDQVRATVARFQAAGISPSKAAVQTAFGCSRLVAIDRVFAIRTKASESELETVLSAMISTSAAKQRRVSSRLVRLRDCTLTAAAMLLQMPVRSLSMLPIEVIRQHCCALEQLSPRGRCVQQLVDGWSSELSKGAAQLWGETDAARFRGVRANRGFLRSADACLRGAMTELDESLCRDVAVFRHLLLTTTADFASVDAIES